MSPCFHELDGFQKAGNVYANLIAELLFHNSLQCNSQKVDSKAFCKLLDFRREVPVFLADA